MEQRSNRSVDSAKDVHPDFGSGVGSAVLDSLSVVSSDGSVAEGVFGGTFCIFIDESLRGIVNVNMTYPDSVVVSPSGSGLLLRISL